MLATNGSYFPDFTLLTTISINHATAFTLLATIGLLIFFLLGIRMFASEKDKTSQQEQPKKQRSSPPASWHKPSHRSRKQKHKVYVAPVIKRKWRTPRRSSH